MDIFGLIYLAALFIIFLALAGFRAHFRETGEHILEALADALSKLVGLTIFYILYTDFWAVFCRSIITHLGH